MRSSSGLDEQRLSIAAWPVRVGEALGQGKRREWTRVRREGGKRARSRDERVEAVEAVDSSDESRPWVVVVELAAAVVDAIG